MCCHSLLWIKMTYNVVKIMAENYIYHGKETFHVMISCESRKNQCMTHMTL